jgi:hypothetical protein
LNRESSIEDTLLIAEKFLNHLESLERMVAYSDLIENEYNLKKDKSLGELVDLIINVKSILAIREDNPEARIEHMESDEKLIQTLDELKTDKDLVRYMYNNLLVENTEDGLSITSDSSFVRKVIDSHINESFKLDSDITQLLNSIIISLVTGMELLIAELFKDFIQNVDKSDFIKTKSLSYSELIKIGTIEEARVFLIDEYIEGLLKQSFKHWIDEIEKKMSIKVKSIPILFNDLEKIFEVIQRRHLLIHNNGEINSLYLAKIHPDLVNGFEIGDTAEIDKEYIDQSITIFRRFGIVLTFIYAEKKHRKEKNELFSDYNNLLLTISNRNKNCLGARYVYKEVSSDSTYDHESMLISKINYFLNYRHAGDFDKIKSEVENFNVSTLSVEYKMARNILLQNYVEALENFKSFCMTLDENMFINVIDWPLIKLARESSEFSDHIKERLDLMIKNEEGVEVGV